MVFKVLPVCDVVALPGLVLDPLLERREGGKVRRNRKGKNTWAGKSLLWFWAQPLRTLVGQNCCVFDKEAALSP